MTHKIPSIAFLRLNDCTFDVADLINLCFFGQDNNIFINRRTLHCNQKLIIAEEDASIMWYQHKDYYESHADFNSSLSIIKVHGVANSQKNRRVLDFLLKSTSIIVLLADLGDSE